MPEILVVEGLNTVWQWSLSQNVHPRVSLEQDVDFVIPDLIVEYFRHRPAASLFQCSSRNSSWFGVSTLLAGRRIHQVFETQFLQRLLGHQLTAREQDPDEDMCSRHMGLSDTAKTRLYIYKYFVCIYIYMYPFFSAY